MQVITTAIKAQYAQYEFEMAHNKALVWQGINGVLFMTYIDIDL